jgi:hypothetical protein
VADQDEVVRLREERDALEQRVDLLEARPERRRRAARITATILTVLAVLVFAVVVPGTWARRTLLNTDRYVATVAPLASDPAVQEYLARTVTEQVFVALDIQTRLAGVLRERAPRLAFLAGPIATGVEGFVKDQLQTIFGSEAFATAWEEANRFVHTQLIAVLEGGDDTVREQNGAIVLNLLPLVNQGLAAMSGLVTDLIGHPVTLPEISGDEVPSAAITRLESALGVDLPDQFGTVTVYNSEDLAAVQQGVDLAGRLIILLAVLFLLFSAAALLVSPRKRRTLLQLAIGLAVILVVERRFAIAEGNAIIDRTKPENQAAARAVLDQVVGTLLRYTGWFLAVAVIVLLVALLSGPYPWSVRLRRWTADVVTAAGGIARAQRTSGASVWVAAHRDVLMLGGAVVAVFALLVTDLSLVGFLVLAVVIGIFEFVVYRAATTVPADSHPVDPR